MIQAEKIEIRLKTGNTRTVSVTFGADLKVTGVDVFGNHPVAELVEAIEYAAACIGALEPVVMEAL